jgi:dipeptidyl aminopeptidase/acylaminoacyl peptidase
MSFGVPTVLGANLFGVSSLCLTSGSYFPYQTSVKMFQEKGEFILSGLSWRKMSSGEIIKVRPDFWQSIKISNSIKFVKKMDLPIFIIHGDRDEKIPVEYAKKIYEIIINKNKRIKILPGGDHGIIRVPPEIRQEFLKDVVQWFQETL